MPVWQPLRAGQPETAYQVVKDVAEALDLKMGKVAQPLRVAIVGRAASPSIDVTLNLVGQAASLRRIDKALDLYCSARGTGINHMSEDVTPQPSNFIRDIIDADLAAGKNEGRVATRFPPEPNGYLHIGHAKSICLNFGIANDYQGHCNLRFDDTNPHKENIEFVESIQQDVRWLGYEWGEQVYYASDYFEKLYDCAVELIKQGKAYVCDLNAEETRDYRGTLKEAGKNSPYRERSVEENLDLFARMRAGRISGRHENTARENRHGIAEYEPA